MARKLKPSDRVLLWSVGVATALGIGAWLWLPGAPWWVYAGGALIVGGMLYQNLLKHFADEAQVDRDRE